MSEWLSNWWGGLDLLQRISVAIFATGWVWIWLSAVIWETVNHSGKGPLPKIYRSPALSIYLVFSRWLTYALILYGLYGAIEYAI